MRGSLTVENTAVNEHHDDAEAALHWRAALRLEKILNEGFPNPKKLYSPEVFLNERFTNDSFCMKIATKGETVKNVLLTVVMFSFTKTPQFPAQQDNNQDEVLSER